MAVKVRSVALIGPSNIKTNPELSIQGSVETSYVDVEGRLRMENFFSPDDFLQWLSLQLSDDVALFASDMSNTRRLLEALELRDVRLIDPVSYFFGVTGEINNYENMSIEPMCRLLWASMYEKESHQPSN